MQPRTDGRSGGQIAVVDADLCAACGICAGACPSSTPFRSTVELVSGIDMPQLPVGQLRSRLKAQIARLKGEAKVVVFGCDQGADLRSLQSRDTAVVNLLCSGQLPPAFVEYALRSGADGVLVAACPEGGCEFRLGGRWIRERLLGLREPHLRRTVAPKEWRLVWAGPRDLETVRRELDGLRAQLRERASGRPDLSEAADA
jgi:coenzyme F420-reducing hydrogenase delta subunit